MPLPTAFPIRPVVSVLSRLFRAAGPVSLSLLLVISPAGAPVRADQPARPASNAASQQPSEKSTVSTPEQDGKSKPPVLEACELGDTPNTHRFGRIFLAGQPSPDDFRLAKRDGVRTVINLRPDDELEWDEPKLLKELELEYHHLPFRSPESLKDELFEKSRRLLSDRKQQPLLLHCASANRVGAIWLVHRVLDDRVPLDAALKEAREVGLRSAPLEQRARDYIRQVQAEKRKPAPPQP